MEPITTTPTLEALLAASKATTPFKQAVADFAAGKDSPFIQYSPSSPRIKVLRVLMQLLETFPEEAIGQVVVDGRSSCSSYTGQVTFSGSRQRAVDFSWDCSWRAQQEGFETWYGGPDQSKAALMFGHRCFKTFELVEA